MNIQYVPYQSINKLKWDECIDSSSNGLVYAYADYLDCMSDNWDALILNDYEAVMPLTWKKKYGIHYLYQPFFCASLGIFSNRKINEKLMQQFLQAVPSKFKYWDVYLNHGNYFPLPEFGAYTRMNYVLPLEKDYETLFKGFRESTRRNIKKAEALNCTVRKNISIAEVIALAKNFMSSVSPITDEHFMRFEKLYALLFAQNKATTYGVFNTHNQLMASAVFFFSHQRAYYILVGNHPDGKTIGASHFLINAFIKDHAGKNLLLDFEGSDIRNLAFFYSSFGAVEEKYTALKLNQLPRLIRWMKK